MLFPKDFHVAKSTQETTLQGFFTYHCMFAQHVLIKLLKPVLLLIPLTRA